MARWISRDRRRLVAHAARVDVGDAEAHGAEADRRDRWTVLAQLALYHLLLLPEDVAARRARCNRMPARHADVTFGTSCHRPGWDILAAWPTRFRPGSVRAIRRSWSSSVRPAISSRRKLLPGLFHLSQRGLHPRLPHHRRLARRHRRRRLPQGRARSALDEFAHAQGDRRATGRRSPPTLDYVPLAAGADGAARRGRARPRRRSAARCRRLHYLSVPPERRAVGRAHARRRRARRALAHRHGEAVRHRPRERASSLNASLHEVFDEEQIFRIDHFLGKEPAQNILAFRFANGLFEPIWNRNFIDHVQIDVPETLGPRQARAGFYETDRRLPRHGGHPPLPDPRLRRDGAADGARADADQRGEEQGLPQHAADRADATSCAASTSATATKRASTRSPRPRRSSRSSCFIDNWRWAGRAVLPAHRQAAGRGAAHHLDRLPRAAQEHVPAGLGRRRARAPIT